MIGNNIIRNMFIITNTKHKLLSTSCVKKFYALWNFKY